MRIYISTKVVAYALSCVKKIDDKLINGLSNILFFSRQIKNDKKLIFPEGH